MTKRTIFLAISIAFLASSVAAQGYVWTYQGKLTDNGFPANGVYDIRITQLEAIDQKIGADTIFEDVQVVKGVFSVNVTTGALILIENRLRFIEIAVRPGASTDAFTVLSPRQPVNMAPYAGRAATAGEANYAVVAGTITDVLPIEKGGTGSSKQNFVDLSTDQTVAGNKTFTGNISGNGSGITNINGANITVGTVNSNQLTADAQPRNASSKMLGSLRWDLLKGQAEISLPSNVSQLAFDGTHVWAMHSTSVSKIRVSDGVVVATLTIGNLLSGITFDGTSIWVSQINTDTVSKYRASDLAPLGDFSSGGGPFSLAFDGTNIWVVNINAGTISKLRSSDGVNQGTFPVSSPYGIAFDGANIWVTNSGNDTVTKLRASDGSSQGVYAVGDNPQRLVFDGANIWIGNFASSNVTKLRAYDGSNLGTISVSQGPFALTFDGESIWVSNRSGNSVSRLRASDGALLSFQLVPNGPAGSVFDGSNIWIGKLGSNSVIRLAPAFPEP